MEDLAELLERRKTQYQGGGAHNGPAIVPSSKLLSSPGGGSPSRRSQQQQQQTVAQHPQPRSEFNVGFKDSEQPSDRQGDETGDEQYTNEETPGQLSSSPGFQDEARHHSPKQHGGMNAAQGFGSPSARTLGTQSPPGASHKKMIDTFLRGVREIGRHRCPSERELDITKDYLNWLAFKTREDHVRSVDEIVTQIPTQFNEEIRKLQQAEDLIYAAAAGRKDKVQKNLEENWELTQAVDRDGRTALHAAAAVDQSEVVEMLLDKGLKINTQDYEGYTGLHWAVENNAAHAAHVLLQRGADILLRTNEGYTVLDLQNDPTETKEAEMIAHYLNKAKEEQPNSPRKPDSGVELKKDSSSRTSAAGERR
eukprot:gb/GECG01016693.1/.p1 GENE.gb/GECG01016693.1/~~gb/GECG01016693.1/.p1  ORF type:complete len:366 (+),score=63.01 gb/GECG01016693.1/:1-1098(+)